jgi:hypothetical protein
MKRARPGVPPTQKFFFECRAWEDHSARKQGSLRTYMASRLGTETNPFPVLRDDGEDSPGPVTDRLSAWTLPLVWFVVAVVLVVRMWV